MNQQTRKFMLYAGIALMVISYAAMGLVMPVEWLVITGLVLACFLLIAQIVAERRKRR